MALGRRRRARAARGVDAALGHLVRRGRPRAARVRPRAALPARCSCSSASPRCGRGSSAPCCAGWGSRSSWSARSRWWGGCRRRRSRPTTGQYRRAAELPAHLLELDGRLRRRRPRVRALRVLLRSPAGGRARARGGGVPGPRRHALLHVLARRRSRSPAPGSWSTSWPGIRAACSRRSSRSRRPRTSRSPGPTTRSCCAGERFDQPVAAAEREDVLTAVIVCALAAAALRALLLLGRPRASPASRSRGARAGVALAALVLAMVGTAVALRRARAASTASARSCCATSRCAGAQDLRGRLLQFQNNRARPLARRARRLPG